MDFNEYFKKVIENLAVDNTLPFVKTEVVYDTFLYPEVLIELLKTAGITAKYVTKEFPIDKKALEINEAGYVSVDYLLVNHDRKEFYLVELKTTNSSFDYEQLRRYTVAIKNFSSIIDSYINHEYATDKAYDVQRISVINSLPALDKQNNEIDYKRYKVRLVYIIPGFKNYISIQERIKQAAAKKTKNSTFYNELYRSLEKLSDNSDVETFITISLNKIIADKNGFACGVGRTKSFTEYNILDQFLYIWYRTMTPKEKQLPIITIE